MRAGPELREIETAFDELLRIRSTRPAGGERAAAEWLRGFLKRYGVDSEVVCKDPDRPNVLAHIGAPNPERGPVVLISHVDVVEAEAERWRYAPFSARHAEGRVWARGTLDTKHLTLMELYAFLSLLPHAERLDREVWLIASIDEECGSEYGMRAVREQRPELFQNAWVINEGGGFPLRVHGKDYMTVTVGEKGVCTAVLTAEGTPGHASAPGDDQAVQKLAGALHAVFSGRLEQPGTGLREAIAEAFDTDAPDSPVAGAILSYAGENSPVIRNYCVGERSNVLPARVRAEVEFRILPGVTRETVGAYLERCCAPFGVSFELTGFESGFVKDVKGKSFTEFSERLKAACADNGFPCAVVPMLAFGRTDGRFFGPGAEAVYGCSPLLLEDSFDEILPKVHGDNESITEASFRFGCAVLRRLTAEECGSN